MSVGVMEDYKLRDLRASHTLGAIGGRRPQEEEQQKDFFRRIHFKKNKH